jgi:hypothetical protein
MDEPLIRDIPSIRKTLEDMNNLTTCKRIMPLLRPFFKLLGVNTENIDDALTNIDELAQQAEEFASIPDRFNTLFASHGWIIYDFMNANIAKLAIEQAESGHIKEAEETLVDYYSVETVRWQLKAMKAIEAFRPRIPLAYKALVDYFYFVNLGVPNLNRIVSVDVVD